MLDTSDAAKARSFLESQAKRAGAHAASYRGVAYQVTPEGVAFAVVDRFAVIGSEAGLHSVIDTTLGGPSLAHAAGYAKLRRRRSPGTLAHLYVQPERVQRLRVPHRRGSRRPRCGLLAGTRETNISLVPSTTSIALDADALASGSATAALRRAARLDLAKAPRPPANCRENPGWPSAWATSAPRSAATSRDCAASPRSASSLGGSGAEAPAPGALSLKGLLEGILTPLSVLGADSAEARRDFAELDGLGGDLRERHAASSI